MENKLQIFENPEFGKIRTVLIDGEPYFSGKDTATALGYENINKTLARFFGKEAMEEYFKKIDYIFEEIDGWYVKQHPEIEGIVINEYGVRLLIDNSGLPEDQKKKFKYWIILEVFCSSFGNVKNFSNYSIKNPEVMVRFFQDYKEYIESSQYQEDQLNAWKDLLVSKFKEFSLAPQEQILSCVYVLEMSNGTVKIGYTRNIDKRMRNISSGSGLEIIKYYATDLIDSEVAYSIEQECHVAFDTWRIKGEFFDITFDEACAKLKEIFSAKFNNNDYLPKIEK